MADMNRLDQLPEITEKAMGGLQAGPGLKYRIIQESTAPKKHIVLAHPAIALACAAALVLCVVCTPLLKQHTGSPIVMMSAGETAAPLLVADTTLRGGDVTAGTPDYQNLWAATKGSTFPLVNNHGSVYRMLATPSSVSPSLLGSVVGEIDLVTDEPALASSALLSNVASLGEKVYAVKGMGGTFVACSVDGTMRLFQRTSFNGIALNRGEALADTLQIKGHVTAMSLSGVGTVTDQAAINKLVSLLLDASYESAGQVSGKQSLILTLDNGLKVQLAVKGNRFSGCGTWSAPSFFESFATLAE